MRLINDSKRADKWHTQGFSMDTKINDIEFVKYTIFYHNIIKSLQFLIGHKRFEQDLVYNPICQYALNSILDLNVKNNDKRLYGEINTKNWL